MKPGRGRIKGNTFERKVAKLIIKAAGKGFSGKDCHRTPLSGGHRYECKSDLKFSNRLRRLFPFSVEAKHEKTFKIVQIFNPTKRIRDYLDQATRAAKKEGVAPMVVAMGNATPILSFVPLPSYESFCKNIPHFRFKHEGNIWCGMLFSKVLKRLEKRSNNV